MSTRIVVPVKKFRLSEEQLSKPIPTLSDRQFVVNRSKLSDAETRIQRELFWYREELFKCIRGRWQEVSVHPQPLYILQSHQRDPQTGGMRSGDLSLRQQRMTLPMLETLRMETAQVHLSLAPCDDTLPLLQHGGKYHPQPNEFVYLRMKITNLSGMYYFTLIYLAHRFCVQHRHSSSPWILPLNHWNSTSTKAFFLTYPLADWRVWNLERWKPHFVSLPMGNLTSRRK